jgi:transcription antitermination factor NusG
MFEFQSDPELPNENSQSSFPWYAVKVRSRSEKLVDQVLKGKGFESYLPTYRSRRFWSDRTVELHEPLYPGYVFCRFEFDYRLPVLQSIGVVDIVMAGRAPLPVPQEDIVAIRRIVDSELISTPWPFLDVGQRVEICKGPLRGLRGILLIQKRHYRLVVSIPLLQRSVKVEIEGDWVRPLPASM